MTTKNIKDTQSETTSCLEISSWEDENCKIKTSLLRGIYGYGFERPSTIQQRSIPSICANHDIIAQAQSGTGKTGAFIIGMLQNINEDLKSTQAIVISPTRELAKQSYIVAKVLGEHMEIHIQLLIGGNDVYDDIDSLKDKTPHVIIGCVGRIYDMICRNFIDTRTVKMLVLDEADEMLSGGFKDKVYNVFRELNESIQIILFSATLPIYVLELIDTFMINPVKILVKSDELSLKGISQYKVELDNDLQKYDTVVDLFENMTLSQCILYCNSVRRVCDLYSSLESDGFPVTYIHSRMSFKERTKNFNDFKKGVFKILISSDITSRGIDIQQVSLVINFDFCKNTETYIHRIGRSGRWGRKGLAINFVTRRDKRFLRNIERKYDFTMEILPQNFMEKIEL